MISAAEKLLDKHNFRTCIDDECEECQSLVDHGIVIACDYCGNPGHEDAPHGSWLQMPDGMIACRSCAGANN